MSRLLPLNLVLLLSAATALPAQTYKVLYSFGSQPGDPSRPQISGIVSQSRGGNLFSSAPDSYSTVDQGSAFRISPSGKLKVVHRFWLPRGVRPVGGLTLATDGLYYGTNNAGGTHGHGNVFKMKQGGGLTVLHAFDSACGDPVSPPIKSVKGDFYGTASSNNGNGCIYRISASGQFKVLHAFTGADGSHPFAPLVQGSDFYFYGTTAWGGAYGWGTIFRISASGDFKVLFNFDYTHGAAPESPMIEASDGNFYGTAIEGGAAEDGVVFKMTPGYVVTVLHDFCVGNCNDGATPAGGLVQATDGNFYGTNTGEGSTLVNGVLYRISPAGDFAVLHYFSGDDGAVPFNTLMQHTNGILYGTTEAGGTAGTMAIFSGGTFFSFDLGLPPFVKFLPDYGRAGAVVEILGQGFDDATQVFFNGIPAASTAIVYPTYLKATVPDGATTGPITVTTADSTLTSNKVFIVH